MGSGSRFDAWVELAGSGLRRPLPGLALAAALLLALAGCGHGGAYEAPPPGDLSGAPAQGVVYVVRDTAGYAVVGATVVLVPVTEVDTRPISGADVLDGSAEDRDEPLEDAVALRGVGFPQGLTGPDGRAVIECVPDGSFFPYVATVPGDDEHLPGGSGCQLAVQATAIRGRTLETTVSCRPLAGTLYVGTSICLSCHQDQSSFTEHAHRLGFAVPGQFTSLQDPVRYPDYTGGWDRFLLAPAYTGGTVVWFHDYDGTRGFDKFKTSLTDPTPQGGVVYVKGYLWRDSTAGGIFKITLVNVINPANPARTFPVALTYGGAVYKQRHLLSVAGRKGRYPFLQWQPEGDEASVDRTRKVYRDYHLDWFWDPATLRFKDPPTSATFEGTCAGCHFNGFERYQDVTTGEWLARGVADANGAFDVDGNGDPDEINLGCENCHGPGRGHIFWAANPANAGRQARYILTPQNLSPSRQIMLCGRCHDRPVGHGTVPNEEPLDPENQMPPPGVSRSEYLATYTTRKGPALSDYWAGALYSKSHHQQYSDLLKSPMHQNDRYLTTCSDCHRSHGEAPYEHHLDADPADPDSLLCWNCHLVDELGAHTEAETGFDHTVWSPTNCVDCHQPKTAKTGAGRYGHLLVDPPASMADAYFVNDIASHLFRGVPGPDEPGVDGVLPGDAMPIPYTNWCTFCHDPSDLYPKPGAPARLVLPAPDREPDDTGRDR